MGVLQNQLKQDILKLLNITNVHNEEYTIIKENLYKIIEKQPINVAD